jgi:hypothetical protein
MTALPPLLAIAEGRKVRARKAPRIIPKESKLHYEVAQLLRDHAFKNWMWTHFPSGELRDVRTAVKLKRFGLRRGWPDFLILSPFSDRQLHGLELKRLGEDLTEEQEEWRDWALAHGGKYAVAWTMDEVIAALDAWGCLRLRIPARPEAPIMEISP